MTEPVRDPSAPPGTLRIARFAAAATAAALGVIALALGLWEVRDLVFVAFLGVLFGLPAAAGAERLAKFRVPRAAGAALIVVGACAVLGGVGAWLAPTLRRQSAEIQARVPDALGQLDAWLASHDTGPLRFVLGAPAAPADRVDTVVVTPAPAVVAPPQAGPTVGQPTAGQPPSVVGAALRARLVERIRTAGAGHGDPLRVVRATVAAFTGLLLAIFLALYFAVDPAQYARGVLALLPAKRRERGAAVLSSVAIALRRWLVAQLLTMAVLGVATTAILLGLHVRAALALGVLTALTKFIPTVGAFLSGVPAVAMAFLTSPHTAVLVAVAFVLLQFLENHLLVPVLMQRIDLPPALTLLAQGVMTLLFGPLGLLVAVPLLAAVMVLVRELVVSRRPAGEVAVTDAIADDAAHAATAPIPRHAHDASAVRRPA
ncbi:AI-2E family transporter [Gemmatimonadetes bacterium T265]|nr:AI-2E family transporter [Gemmatimonadetes bacterium T265]